MKRHEAKVFGQLQRWIQPQFIGRRRAGRGLELGDQTLALGFKGREDAERRAVVLEALQVAVTTRERRLKRH
jgi:hypothetical protein